MGFLQSKRAIGNFSDRLRVMVGDQNIYHGPQQDLGFISLESITREVLLEEVELSDSGSSFQIVTKKGNSCLPAQIIERS
jgi:hypothetical protein